MFHTCLRCDQWNLTSLEEGWEALEKFAARPAHRRVVHLEFASSALPADRRGITAFDREVE